MRAGGTAAAASFAGVLAARQFGAAEVIDPRPYAVGTIAATFKKYPATGALLPAMGYGQEQMNDLQATIEQVPCDAVVIGTPIDLRRVITISKPSVRVTYTLQETTKPDLGYLLDGFIARYLSKRRKK